MKGLKWGARMVLERIESGITWENYITNLNSMAYNVAASSYTMNLEGTTIRMGKGGRARFFTFVLDGVNYKTPYIPTKEGIRFYEPVTINGVSVQNFKWNEAAQQLEGTDGLSMIIKGASYPLNEAFFASTSLWNFDTQNMGPGFSTYYQGMVSASASEGEALTGLLFGKVSLTSPTHVFQFKSGPYTCQVSIDFIPVVGTSSNIDLNLIGFPSGSAGGNASYYYGTFPAYKNFINNLGSRYKMEADDERDPWEILFTDTSYPDYWFRLELN